MGSYSHNNLRQGMYHNMENIHSFHIVVSTPSTMLE